MKRTLAGLAIAALTLAGCSSAATPASAPSPSSSQPAIESVEVGRIQTVKGEGWEAEIIVSDPISREQNYYGEIKPEWQYRATVSVRSIIGATPVPSTAFAATLADGSSLTVSIGAETDDMKPGDVPQGQERSGPVTWTGKPDAKVAKIEYVADGFVPVATWTVSTPPARVAPSTMPNHDEIVSRETPSPTENSEVPAQVVVTTPPSVVEIPETTEMVVPQAPIGFTGAPNGKPAPLSGKVVDYCMDGPAYQRGTTAFTDGTTGWTQECAG